MYTKHNFRVMLSVILLLFFSGSIIMAQENEKQVLVKRETFLQYYDSGNHQEITKLFHKDATFAGTLGPMWLNGSGEIENLWRNYFATWPARELIFRGQGSVGAMPDLKFFLDDMVSVETGFMLMYMGPEGKPPVVTNIRYSITRIKEDGDWLIVNMNVHRIPGQ